MKKVLMIAGIALVAFGACKNGKREVQVLLTDAPGDYDEINVEIIDVSVNINNDTNWVSLNTNSGVYNLLDFQNGVTTPIASGTVPQGTVKELRFILGSDNSVLVDGQHYPLILSSQQESGLKIKVNKKLEKDLNTLIIDFDGAQSVVKEQSTGYRLHPVLRIK